MRKVVNALAACWLLLAAVHASGDTTVAPRERSAAQLVLVVAQWWGLGYRDRMLFAYNDGRVIRKREFGYRLQFDTLMLDEPRRLALISAVEAARQDSLKSRYGRQSVSDPPGLEFIVEPGATQGTFLEGLGFDPCQAQGPFLGDEPPPQSLIRLCEIVRDVKRDGKGRRYQPSVRVHLELGKARRHTKPWPKDLPVPQLDGKTSVDLRYDGRHLPIFAAWGLRLAVSAVTIGKQSWDVTYDVAVPGE